MSIEVELPQEIELTIKAKRELGALVRKRIERDIAKDIKMIYSYQEYSMIS